MPPENKTAAVRCRCTIIVLHKTLSIINTTLNTTYYVHFSWKQMQIHNPVTCLIVYVSQNLGCKPSEKLDKESKKGWGQGKILRSKVYHECFC